MSDSSNEIEPNFCSKCGLSLVKLNTWCSSRSCNDCGKEVFFVRRAENGGVRIEKGESFHIPSLTFSLDPSNGSYFTRYGLEGFIKQFFLENKLSKEEFVEKLKETEQRLDKELMNLDCIQHVNLETDDGVAEALDILEKEQLSEYKFNLMRSASLRSCYTSVEAGNALDAAYSNYHAEMFKAYSVLEHYHLKEIIWLGYQCYVDLVKNENATNESSKQQILISNLEPKITSLKNEVLYALAKDGEEIAPRLGVQGLSESTLKSLLEHELNKRETDKEEYYKDQEIDLKKKSNTLKVLGVIFTLVNGLILALYKNWLG